MNSLEDSSTIEPLTRDLAHLCEAQFINMGWKKAEGYFHSCHSRQQTGELVMFVAHQPDVYIGHAKLIWESTYPFFNKAQIPEIQDLNVVPEFRQCGVATALIAKCEEQAFRRSNMIGIGVGLHPGYNAAQRLYSRLGYRLDGEGVHYQNKPVEEGKSYLFDDDLVIYFTKAIS